LEIEGRWVDVRDVVAGMIAAAERGRAIWCSRPGISEIQRRDWKFCIGRAKSDEGRAP
jgi:hypothetical protein